MEIRRYTRDDADGLAALFRRSHYGPDVELDGEAVHEVLRERVCQLCLVAVEDAAVYGCLAVCSSSGRRSAEEGEGFVGTFVIDRSLRNSSLAGRLFVALFSQIVMDTGIRRLRVEVDPSNRKALPLYLRVGFRALPGTRADEDGYIELVSDLSSLVRDLCGGRFGPVRDVDLPSLRWKPVAGGRGADTSEGVRTLDGRDVVTHTIATDEFSIRATMDFATGEIVGVETLTGEPLAAPEAVQPAEEVVTAQPVLVETKVGDLRLCVDACGSLTLSRDDDDGERVIIREMWPVEIGERAPGQRRQPARPVRVTTTGPSSWRLECEGDALRRDISIGDRALTLTTTPAPGREALVTPWIAARKVELGLRGRGGESGGWEVGPLVQGLWPESWTDFEAACPTSAEAACLDDGHIRLLMTWTGRARVEARTVAALRSAAPGQPVTLAISLLGVMPTGTNPDALTPVVMPQEMHNGAPARPCGTQLASPPVSRPEMVVLTGDRHRLEIVPSVGIIDWTLGGSAVLTGSYPAHSVYGALAARRAGLWCTGLADRDDPDQGLEWAADCESLAYDGQGAVGPAHETKRNGTWSVRALQDGVEVKALTEQWPEAAIHLAPTTADHPCVVISVRGRCHMLESGTLWRGAVDGAGIPLADGRMLVVTGHGPRSEVFVRNLSDGVMATVTARGSVRAHLRVVPGPSQAVALLAEGTLSTSTSAAPSSPS